MKQQSLVFFVLVFFVLLLSSFSASARLLLPKHGEKEGEASDIAHARSSAEFNYETELMGSEECAKEHEECSRRRMIAEAHLDYIYTQHKPSYKKEP